jgi:hypothetical protein
MLAAVLALCALVPAAATPGLAHEGLLPAPYQIDGLVCFKSDRFRLDDGLGLNAPLVAVDLGDARKAPHPDSKRLATMTFVGSAGIGFGKLTGIQKHCDYLCGDAGEECHYVGLYVLDDPVERIGTPLIAIPGAPALARFQAPLPAAAGAEAVLPQPLIGRDFTDLAWAPYGKDGPELRIAAWDGENRGLELEGRWRSGDRFQAEGRNCALRRIDEVTEVQCDGVALIVGDAAPLLLSYPDYNLASAQVVATLGLGKATLYLVRLGLKAQTAFGLLYRDKDGWRGLFRPRDYALLC